jgi:hypothetical protein
MPRIHRYAPLTSSQHVIRAAAVKELNTRRCPVCGAKKGQTCFVLTGTRFIELKTTHATQAREAGIPLPKQRVARPPRTPMALDKTLDAPAEGSTKRKRSTEQLDREDAARKAREAAGERRRNGG